MRSLTRSGTYSMNNNVWKLMFISGSATKVVKHAEDRPLPRKVALDKAVAISRNGWRVWIEHYQTGKRLFENDAERSYRLAR